MRLAKRQNDFKTWLDNTLGKPRNPDRRLTAHLSITIVGGATILIGLTVLLGWYIGKAPLTHLYFGSEPMSYNLATAFVFSGAGLLMLTRSRPFLALLFGALAAASGLIALIGLAFGLHLGIDLLLFKPFFWEAASNVAGMTTMTAVAFVLIGIALIVHSFSEQPVKYQVSSGILASLVAACGLAGVVGYLVSIATPFQSYMPVHSIVGVLLVGTALLTLSWSISVSKKHRTPRWIPMTVGFAVSAVALTLFNALAENSSDRAKEIIAVELTSLQSEVQVRMQMQIQAIDRMASRWEIRRRTPLREWEADASLHLSDHSGYEALMWMDASNTVRWNVPSSEMESVPDGILRLAEPISTLINNARLSRQVTITPPFEISPDQEGYVLCAPLFPGGQFDGCLLAAIQFNTFFESILVERATRGYGIAIVRDDGDIYNVRPATRRYEQKWAQSAPILIDDVELFRLRIWPTRPTMEAVRGPLPLIMLSAGLLLALLLAFVTHFVQKSMRRSTELEISHRQLQKESKNRKQVEKRFRLFIENAPEAFVILDPELRIRFVNSRTEELFNDNRDNLIDNSVRILFPERFRDSYALRFANVDKGTRIQHLGTELDLYAVRPDGREFPVEIGLSSIEVNDKEWVLISISDITVRKQAEKVLQQAHDELESMVHERTEQLREKNEELERNTDELARSNAELEQFAYVASHDLKEPLRTIGSYTQLLANRYSGQLDTDADEFIAYAVEGVNRMQILIDELLLFSRVGTSGKPLRNTNVETVVNNALANLDAALSESGAIVTRDALPEVMGDEVQLTTLFQNLIANAIKFQDKKTIEIHIGAENQAKESLFSVRDNGIGFESEHAERVFQIFHQLHGRNEYEGTGMGLAICKKIVERHGGRIWVESEPGKGSTFYFTIAFRLTGE